MDEHGEATRRNRCSANTRQDSDEDCLEDELLDQPLAIRAERPELLRRVVVVTAAAAAIRDRSPKDVAAVILKPFDVEELASTVRRVVSA